MASKALTGGLSYPKHCDFVTKDEFESAHDQLQKSIHKHKAHLLPSSQKASGKRMSLVFEDMWDRENGMLRGYRKVKDHRNFRYGFVEKVLKKVNENQALHKLAGTESTDSVKQLSEIATIYFIVKNSGEEYAKKRKEQTEKDRKTMSKKEAELEFTPKPAYIPQQSILKLQRKF